MRRLLLPITLPLLMLATWLAWQHRFQVDPAHPTLDLADLIAATPLAAGVSRESAPSGKPLLVLQAGTPALPVVQRLPLPGLPPTEFLRFDFRARALDLTPGPMPWADGRLMIEWHPEGRLMEPEYLGSARENYPTEISCLVVSSDLGPSLPILRLEHLGISGSFLLERCRITIVQETVWWRYGRWLLLGGWFAWAAGVASRPTSGLGPVPLRTGWQLAGDGEHTRPRVLRSAPSRSAVHPVPPVPAHPELSPHPDLLPVSGEGAGNNTRGRVCSPSRRTLQILQSSKIPGLGRPLLAAAVWLVCATQWAVPGPWEALRPMAPNFAGMPAPGESAASAARAPAVLPAPPATPAPPPASPAPAAAPAAPESLGELEFHGSLLLKIKDKIKQARPLFHVLLFFAPAFVFAVLVGRWRSVVLTAALAAGIEGSQFLFGYGFDRTDVLDLLQDAAGTGLALLAHYRISGWFQKRRQAAAPPGSPVDHEESYP